MKKWWKRNDSDISEYLPAWFKRSRRRLRAGYRGALERNTINAEANARGYYEKKLAEAQARMDSRVALLERRTEAAERAALEVLRVRLEYGPRRFSTRFTLYATCEETWIRNANDLAQHMEVIVHMLAAKITHEFRQIDFGRVKPNRFEPDEEGRPHRYPVWRHELSNGEGDRSGT